MGGLNGKAALVTGGSRGIGAAIAKRLAADGADVAVTYVNSPDKAAEVVSEIEGFGRRGLALAADGVDAGAVVAAVERTASELGRFDILVNSAGVFPYGPIEEVTEAEVDEALALHVKGAFLAAQAAAAQMNGGGRIINIGSSVVDRVPVPGLTLYAMSKSALLGLTKGLARDLGERGITVNMVHPGPTDTDMNPANGEGANEEREVTALGHYAEVDDIAATVAHIAGDTGRYITGASIAVDGGYSV